MSNEALAKARREGRDLPEWMRQCFASTYHSMRDDPHCDKQELEEYRQLAGIKNQAEYQQEAHEANERALWAEAMLGIKFSCALRTTATDEEFCAASLGPHNSKAKVIRDEQARILGVSRGLCQCDTHCLQTACEFVANNPPLEILAQAAGVRSIVWEGERRLHIEVPRSEALGLELKRERDRAALREARRQTLIAETQQAMIRSGAMNL